MKTKIFAVLTAITILVCVAVPAFAAPVPVNIWEYAEINVDGLTKEVSITFPSEWLQVGVYTNSWRLLASRDGNSSGFDLSEYDIPFEYLNVVYSPLGSVHNPSALDAYNGRYPDFSELPNGSVFHYTVSVQIQNASAESVNVARSTFNRSDLVQSGNTIQLRNPVNEQVSYTADVANGLYTSSYDFILTDNTQPFVFQHYFFMSSSNASSRWIFRLDEFTITTSIDALKELVEATGESNRLLDEINKKLDGITDYQPDPTTPGGGIGEDLEDAEDQLMDGAQQGLQDFTTHTQSFLAWLTGSATAFSAAGTLLGVILDVQIYNDLLYASLILGSFALFLGTAITIFKGRE